MRSEEEIQDALDRVRYAAARAAAEAGQSVISNSLAERLYSASDLINWVCGSRSTVFEEVVLDHFAPAVDKSELDRFFGRDRKIN